MAIKIKNKDPKTYDFNKDDIVINHKEGTLFFKSDSGLQKLSPGDSNSLNTSISSSYAVSSSHTVSSSFATSTNTSALATGILATANNTTNESNYITFIDGATGTQQIETDTTLRYNPSSGIITATGFSGDLTGNADTATSASYALSSSHEIITEISSSHAVSSVSASYAITASHALNSGGVPVSASYATTASHAQKANDFLVNNYISASKASGSDNVGDFHHFGGNVKIGTVGVQGQFYGREDTGSAAQVWLPGKGTVLEVAGGIRMSGSILPFQYGKGDLGSSISPFNSLHVLNSSIHFYSEEEEIGDSDARKLLGKVQFEEGRGLKVKDTYISVPTLL